MAYLAPPGGSGVRGVGQTARPRGEQEPPPARTGLRRTRQVRRLVRARAGRRRGRVLPRLATPADRSNAAVNATRRVDRVQGRPSSPHDAGGTRCGSPAAHWPRPDPPKLRQRWASPTTTAGRGTVGIPSPPGGGAQHCWEGSGAGRGDHPPRADNPQAGSGRAGRSDHHRDRATVEGRRGGPLTRAAELFDKASRSRSGRCPRHHRSANCGDVRLVT